MPTEEDLLKALNQLKEGQWTVLPPGTTIKPFKGRYLLFMGMYCDKGWQSYVGNYEKIMDAEKVRDEYPNGRECWWQIVDTEIMRVLLAGQGYKYNP